MESAHAARWGAPVDDEDLNIDCSFDAPLPPDPPEDPPVEEITDTEQVVEDETPIVWGVIKNWLQVRLHQSFRAGLL